MLQDKCKPGPEQVSECEISELNCDEVLCVAGGLDPEPDNDPHR